MSKQIQRNVHGGKPWQFLKGQVTTGLTQAAVLLLAIFVVVAQVHSAEVKGWEELVKAAQKEGHLTLYGSTTLGRGRPTLDQYFTKAYPGIKVNKTFGRSREVLNRIMAERRAGQYIPDVVISGTTTALLTLKPAGALVPLKRLLLLPEVLDTSAWLNNELWWADANEPYTTLMFQGYVQSMAYANTKLVKIDTLRSHFDLLDPKWKGKMVSTDIRRPGPGGVSARFIYKHPDLGPKYLQRLFGEMDITLSSNQRQMVDWLGTGRFAIGLFLSPREAASGEEQGLPITTVPAENFREGAPIAPGGGAVSVSDRARHPNAATLFVNWLLSKEGQIRWQETQVLPSLRLDIPKEGLYPRDLPKSGAKYVNGGTEEYSRLTPKIRRLITKELSKAKRR